MLSGCGGGGGSASSEANQRNELASLARKAYHVSYVTIAESRLYSFSAMQNAYGDLPDAIQTEVTTNCPNGGYYNIAYKGELNDGRRVRKRYSQRFHGCVLNVGVNGLVEFVSGARDLEMWSETLLAPNTDEVSASYDNVALSIDGKAFNFSGKLRMTVSKLTQDQYPLDLRIDLLPGMAMTVDGTAYHLNGDASHDYIRPQKNSPNLMKVNPDGGIWLNVVGKGDFAVLAGAQDFADLFVRELPTVDAIDTGWVRYARGDIRGEFKVQRRKGEIISAQ
ncbi:hypothetical protein O5O45_09230 [Hahella aquimaris]|uniref:hypothetical protein n=1 Tax=Hahella sp. HNIBRBA332 TaxID=3015983 RepID=UPI00273AB7F3|nr:hypothetical protein [Hahella sp. HNIBRBA332]WLQ16096.1 hypothetical protein O5O45_09230 [Hahella sp. HNIBRBA332]